MIRFDEEIIVRASLYIVHIAEQLKTAHPGHHVPTPDGAKRQAEAILWAALSSESKLPAAALLLDQQRARPVSNEVKPE